MKYRKRVWHFALFTVLRKGWPECDTSEKGEDLSNDYVYRKWAKLVTKLRCVFEKQGTNLTEFEQSFTNG